MALPKSAETKKVNLDFNKKFIDSFTQNIEEGNVVFINQTLKDLHEADVANLIENLSPDTRTKLFEIESFNIDPEIFIELNESIQSEVLQLLSIDSLIKIIKRLESDNAIKILVEAHIPDIPELGIVKRLVSLYLEEENFKDAAIFNDILLREYPDDQSGYINAAIISLNNDSPDLSLIHI